MHIYTHVELWDRIARMEHGETIVINNGLFDAIDSMLSLYLDDERADRYYRECRSLPNPNRVGTLDTHLA